MDVGGPSGLGGFGNNNSSNNAAAAAGGPFSGGGGGGGGAEEAGGGGGQGGHLQGPPPGLLDASQLFALGSTGPMHLLAAEIAAFNRSGRSPWPQLVPGLSLADQLAASSAGGSAEHQLHHHHSQQLALAGLTKALASSGSLSASGLGSLSGSGMGLGMGLLGGTNVTSGGSSAGWDSFLLPGGGAKGLPAAALNAGVGSNSNNINHNSHMNSSNNGAPAGAAALASITGHYFDWMGEHASSSAQSTEGWQLDAAARARSLLFERTNSFPSPSDLHHHQQHQQHVPSQPGPSSLLPAPSFHDAGGPARNVGTSTRASKLRGINPPASSRPRLPRLIKAKLKVLPRLAATVTTSASYQSDGNGDRADDIVLARSGYLVLVCSHKPPVRCQVHGCERDMSCAKEYHRRHRACEAHSKANAVLLNGALQRFCQQCSRFHPLLKFDGEKRSCRTHLMSHNHRRRKQRKSNQAERLAAQAQAAQGQQAQANGGGMVAGIPSTEQEQLFNTASQSAGGQANATQHLLSGHSSPASSNSR
eukprot:jgi/Chlat1/2665/Chrsp179S02511